MTDITYGILEEVFVIGNERRVSYGIAAYSHAESDGTATVIDSVNDVSTDRSFVSELVSFCNQLSLSTCHLANVINDFIEG